MSGTSMACPHVAGAAAVVLSQQLSFGATEVERALETNAGDGLISDVRGSPNLFLFMPPEFEILPTPPPTPQPPTVEPTPKPTPEPTPQEFCSNSCNYANDGDCDDGGPGAGYASCGLGTDCLDCGERPTPAPPAGPPTPEPPAETTSPTSVPMS